MAKLVLPKIFPKTAWGIWPNGPNVRRWAQYAWKGAPNTQVYDMNGFQFLLEFQSWKAAEQGRDHI